MSHKAVRNHIQRLLERDPRPLSVRETILWWERRRIPYNLLVGCAGVVSISSGVLTALATQSECGIPDPPLFAAFGIVLYGIAANAAYTSGWIVELALRHHIQPGVFAQRAFLTGLVFSMLLTLSPALLIPIGCAVTGVQ